VFCNTEKTIGTSFENSLRSNEVLKTLQPGFTALGYDVEGANPKKKTISRPVYFGENGTPSLKYQVDAFHHEFGCGIEVEAGRATRSNAVYRNLIQALVMTQIEHLVMAVPLAYWYNTDNKRVSSKDYELTIEIAKALYGHDRVKFPFDLTVVGY